MSDTSQPNPDVTQDVAQKYDSELASPPIQREAASVSAAELKAGATERAQQRPLLQKIVAVFKKEKGSYRELIINSEPLEKRVALLVDGRLEKYEIERESDDRMVGGIYKGRIKNLDPGLKAAFVDIGYAKNAFLHYWDMLPAAADSSVEVVRINKKRDSLPKGDVTVKDIPGLYPPGSDIVIQVTKGPIGTKGPRTTTNLSIPGRYLILTPYSDGCGISRKIEDPQERKRLKQLINELTIPEGMGVIVRTAGEGKKPRFFVRDLHLLLKKWEEITRKMQSDRAPCCLYMEPDLVERTVRDFLTEDVDRVLIELWRRVFQADPNSRASMLALGGYGRKDLFPFSDIDVLFAFPDDDTEKSLRPAIRAINQAMWDIGLRASPTNRTVKEAGKFDPDNLEFTLATLDRRLITDAVKSGSAALHLIV